MIFKRLIGAGLLTVLGCAQAIAQGPHLQNCQSCQSCGPGQAGCQPIQTNTPPCTCGPNNCIDPFCQQCNAHPLKPGRPTPPPCAADGICYPKPETWGHYATRWRQWPIQYGAAAEAGLGAPEGQTIPPYVLPPLEEEDRRAPPPSAPKRPPGQAAPRTDQQSPPPGEEEGAAPPSETDGTPPGLPPLPTSPEATPDSLFGPSEEETPPTAPLNATPPAEEAAPSTSPLGSPTGDADPPPALPFKSSVAAQAAPRPAATAPVNGRPRDTKRPARGDDPPPAFPLASR